MEFTSGMPGRRFLKPKEAADILGLDETSIYRAIWRGELGASRLGNRWLIPFGEIDRIEAEGSAIGEDAA